MPRSPKVSKYQLPLLCAHCGGPTRALRNSERVLIRCAECGKRLFAYYVDPARADETPPEQEDDFFVKRTERDIVNDLNQSAQVLYEYMRRFIKQYGYAPSYREMRDGLGWESVSTVSRYLKQLIDAGLIEQAYATARSIRMVFAA